MPGRSICYPGRPSAWGAHRLWPKHVPTTPSSSRRLWYGLRPVLAYSGRDISAAAGSLQVSRLPAPRRPVLGRGTGRGYGPRTACLICGRKPLWQFVTSATLKVYHVIPSCLLTEVPRLLPTCLVALVLAGPPVARPAAAAAGTARTPAGTLCTNWFPIFWFSRDMRRQQGISAARASTERTGVTAFAVQEASLDFAADPWQL